MRYIRSLFYPTWRDACFFILGVTIGLITMWIFRKRLEDLPKKIKQIEKNAGHPAVALYLPRGKEKFPKRLYLHGEIPRHSKRIYPKLHPGGRKEGTPYDPIDRQVVDLVRTDRNIDIIQGIRKFLPEYKVKYQEANPDLKKMIHLMRT